MFDCICTKRSAFDMQIYHIVDSIFLKTSVKDDGDLLWRFIGSTLTNLQIIFKPLDRFFKNLRADVCKYRPEVGKTNFLKDPKKNLQTTLGILVMKI